MKVRLPIAGGYSADGWFYTHIPLGAIDRSVGRSESVNPSRYAGLPTLTPPLVQIGFGGWGYTPNQIPHSPDKLTIFHESLGQVDGRPPPVWFTEVTRLLCADSGWEDSIYEECAMRMPLPHFPCPNAGSLHLAAPLTQVLYAKSESVPPNFVAIDDSVISTSSSESKCRRNSTRTSLGKLVKVVMGDALQNATCNIQVYALA